MLGSLERYNLDFLAYFDQYPSASPELKKAIHYALESPGKRLRPFFVQDAAELVSLSPEATRLYSFAIEFIHLFSLIHDDLPCLDNDDFRRGLPTVHKKFNEATALLAGDALVVLAYSTFAKLAPFVEAKNFAAALTYFSNCVGSEGMIGGQMLEMEVAAAGPNLESLLQVQDLKTGALFRASILVPYYLSGISENDERFLLAKSFATDFAYAFQIADDLDDEAQDLIQANKNILSLLGREKAIRLALDKLQKNALSSKFRTTSLLIQKLSSKT